MKHIHRLAVILLLLFLATLSFAQGLSVVLCIGDGMGEEQIRAAGYFMTGEEAFPVVGDFPVKSIMSTYSAGGGVTDSAASATAMATGVKVNNRTISMAVPGGGEDLETILEYCKSKGMSTGVVTTCFITHATPAAFVAHVRSRGAYRQIAADLFGETRPEVVMGGGGPSAGVSLDDAVEAGYQVATDKVFLNLLSGPRVCGLFGDGHMPFEYDGPGELPSLHEMALKALDILEEDGDGFFLMIEGGRIDHGCHDNDIARTVYETREFLQTVEAVADRARKAGDILVIVTADHETGGLKVTGNNGQEEIHEVSWGSDDHTDTPVPLFALGPYSEMFADVTDNAELGIMFKKVVGMGLSKNSESRFKY